MYDTTYLTADEHGPMNWRLKRLADSKHWNDTTERWESTGADWNTFPTHGIKED